MSVLTRKQRHRGRGSKSTCCCRQRLERCVYKPRRPRRAKGRGSRQQPAAWPGPESSRSEPPGGAGPLTAADPEENKCLLLQGTSLWVSPRAAQETSVLASPPTLLPGNTHAPFLVINPGRQLGPPGTAAPGPASKAFGQLLSSPIPGGSWTPVHSSFPPSQWWVGPWSLVSPDFTWTPPQGMDWVPAPSSLSPRGAGTARRPLSPERPLRHLLRAGYYSLDPFARRALCRSPGGGRRPPFIPLAALCGVGVAASLSHSVWFPSPTLAS